MHAIHPRVRSEQGGAGTRGESWARSGRSPGRWCRTCTYRARYWYFLRCGSVAGLLGCGGCGAVEIGCGEGGGEAEFGGDRGDGGVADGEVGLAVSGEVRCDERLVVGPDLWPLRGGQRGVSTWSFRR